MKNYIEISKSVKEKVPLLRQPTPEELKMIMNDEMFDIEGLIDWDKAETTEEDYSYGSIHIEFNGKNILHKNGRHF